MAITKLNYSPSINIIRDNDFDFNYIVTPNSRITFSQLADDILKGNKAHTIIGAHGIGKSSFLLAMEQALIKKKAHFKGYEKVIKQLPSYEFVNIVGEYDSFLDSLAEKFGIKGKNHTSKDVLKAVSCRYQMLAKKSRGLAIIVDEFGKFLEYAAKHNPESELYFIQQLAELVNETSKDLIFIAVLHQNINAYSVDLNAAQRQEWDKVSGRLQSIVFNEPVEQLLFLAGERLRQKFAKLKPSSSFDKLFKIIKESKAFPLREHLELDFAKKLLPFDILSAAILTSALQKYGQNERSLFSFIESDECIEIVDKSDHQFYSIPQAYDYLTSNFYTEISSAKNNKHIGQWSGIREALERLEGVIKPEIIEDASAIIKTIGMLNIFSSQAGKLDDHFYCAYGKLALGIKQPENVLQELVKFKLIKYTKHNFRYSLQTGTDVDIDLAIDDAGRVVEKVTNVVHHLNQYFEFPFISAKAISYTTGTPRFFQFKLSEDPIQESPEDEIDGFINLVFSESSSAAAELQAFSSTCQEPILFGYYKNTGEIKRLLHEIQKVKTAIVNHKNDKAAMKELSNVEVHYRRLLDHFVEGSLYSNNGNIVWFLRGESVTIGDQRSFNQTLTRICALAYPSVPQFRNDLVNRSKLSGQVSKARNNLIQRLISNTNDEHVGFLQTEFPPEKSIFLALLKNTGIHHKKDGFWQLDAPTDGSFTHLWTASETFLASTKIKERNLQEFIDLLSSKPFKLKQGLIDFWIPIFLIVKNDEFALYEGDTFIPSLSGDIFDLMYKKPNFFSIKAFDVTGIKLQLFNRYRAFLNQSEHNQPDSKAFLQTIKPFMSFYKQLPDYAKYTNRLAKPTVALRQTIIKAKDPEKVFFEDFPLALGFNPSDLHKSTKQADQFINKLQASIRELRLAYDELVDRFEQYFIRDVIGTKESFPGYREVITRRYEGLKTHLLLTHQKPFYTRLQSELDDKKAWLASIAQACINKPLSSITDDDELVLFERIKDLVYELDNLSEVAASSVDEKSEEVLKLEITSLVNGLNKSMLRIPKAKTKEVEKKQEQIKALLVKDRKINIAILTKLLQELLANE